MWDILKLKVISWHLHIHGSIFHTLLNLSVKRCVESSLMTPWSLGMWYSSLSMDLNYALVQYLVLKRYKSHYIFVEDITRSGRHESNQHNNHFTVPIWIYYEYYVITLIKLIYFSTKCVLWAIFICTHLLLILTCCWYYNIWLASCWYFNFLKWACLSTVVLYMGLTESLLP